VINFLGDLRQWKHCEGGGERLQLDVQELEVLRSL
jgi:hypothetical protein